VHRTPVRRCSGYTCCRISGQAIVYFFHAIAIISCGVAGACLAWAVVDAFGWSGVGAAVATAFIAMLAATLMWAGGVALGRALRRLE